MKAMIFAAGLGTRLKPLTDNLPKALVPIGKKPLIEHVARKLFAAGFTEAVVNVHYFADKIEEWINEQEWIKTHSNGHEGEENKGKMHMSISDERALLLETGGAVLHARPYLEKSERFIIHNVDILSDCDLNWFVSQIHEDSLADLLVSERDTKRYLLFMPDSEAKKKLRLVGWENTDTKDYHVISPEIHPDECKKLAFSGIHILSNRIFDLMEQYVKEKNLPENKTAGTRFPIMSFYMWAAAKEPIYGVVAEKLNFIDVGKPEALKEAERMLANEKGYT